MSYQPYGPSSDKRRRAPQATIAWVIAILTIGYMLPWAIAASRGKSNSGAIGLINLLLGWSVIGWIVALVMACGSHHPTGGTVVVQQIQPPYQPPAPTAAPPSVPAGWYQAPGDPPGVSRYWDGAAWTQHTNPVR